MRLLIAIELPQEVRDHLVNVSNRLKPQIAKASFTPPESLHITLKFLGEVEGRLTDLKESLVMIRAGGAIKLFAERIECFPHRGPVRILAAGFGGSVAGVAALHQAIEQRCQHLGFERETRAYRPHATLVRGRPTWPPAVRGIAASAATDAFPGPTFEVSEFILMRSHLQPQGSRYEIIERFSP